MDFNQLYSGSSGNLYTVTANNGKRLLIECGVTWSKLQRALKYDLNGIEACFLTHEHEDHSKAVKNVLKAGIDVYCSHGTVDALGLDNERRIGVVADKTLVKLEDFQVYCFDTNHDAAEPLGFIVRADNEFLLFAIDTSHITQQFKYQFNIIAIECSFEAEILHSRVESGAIPESCAKRLLESHMEKQTTIDYIDKFCDLSKCREIDLLHMSSDNINSEKTRVEFEKRYFRETKIVKCYIPLSQL